jgi:hypothetical protein
VFVTVGYKVDSAGLQKAKSEALGMANSVSSTQWAPPTFKPPVMDLRAAEAAGMNMGNAVSSGLGGAMTKMEQETEKHMGQINRTLLGSAGIFGNIASAAGPIGIATAAFVGGAYLAEQAAERWQDANRKVANALKIDLRGSDMAKLMDQFQSARMQTGIDAGTITSAAAGAAARVGQDQLGGAAESISIYATKWKADASSVASDMTNLGTSIKSQTEDWTTFIDKNGASIDALAKKYNSSGADILTATNKMMPSLARTGVKESAMPGIEALLASGQSWGLDGNRMAAMLNSTGLAMQGKVSVDLAKLLNVDTSTFETMLQTDLTGTIEKVSTAMAAMPDKGAALLSKLGKGKDLMSILGDPAKAKELAENLGLANDAFSSGTSAMDAYASHLDTAGGQMERLGQIWDVSMEVMGKPIIGAAATGLNALNNTLITIGGTLRTFGTDAPKVFSGIEASASALLSGKGLEGSDSAFMSAMGIDTSGKRQTGSGPNWTSESDLVAATAGSSSGNSFVDALNSKLQSGIPNSVSSAYLKSGGLSAKSGGDAGKAWGDSFAAYLEANVSPQIAALLSSGLTNEQAIAMISSQSKSDTHETSTSSSNLLSNIPGNSLMSWTSFESEAKGSFIKVFKDGKQIAEEAFQGFDPLKYTDQVSSWPKAMKAQKDTVSKIIADTFSDGVVSWEERGALQNLDDTLKAELKRTDLSLDVRANVGKLKTDVDNALKLIEPQIDILMKPVWEDWKSQAYQQKWFFDNPEIAKNLTPTQGGDLTTFMGKWQDIADNKDGKYSKAQVAKAQEVLTATSNVFTAVKTGDASADGLMGTSISVLQSIDSNIMGLGTWMDTLNKTFMTERATAFNTGTYKSGSFMPSVQGGYSGQSAYSSGFGTPSTSIQYGNPGLSSMIGNFINSLPKAAGGAYTGDYEGPIYVHKNEMILSDEDTKYYSDMWTKDYNPNITPPTSAFQSKEKSGWVPITQSGTPVTNPWTDQSILNPAYMRDMQQKYSGNSLVKPSADLQNPKVVDYSTPERLYQDKYFDVQDKGLKAALQASDAMLLRTAADGKYCEAVSDFAIAQEEATGLFKDAYIGPTKYYSAAKSFSSSQNSEYSFKEIVDNTKDTAKNTQSIKIQNAGLSDFLKTITSAGQSSPGGKMQYGGDGINRQIQITQSMIDAARNSEDEYAQISMGLQPFAYGLAQFSAENGKFCQAISDFGLAQEYSGNFNPSYVGVQTSKYSMMKEAESTYGANSEQVQILAEQLKISEVGQGILNAQTEAAKKTEKNTKDISTDMKASMAGGSYDASGKMVYGGGGGQGWGGRSFNGGGGWIGTSGVMGGMNGGTYYGSTAGNGNVSWGGATASNSISSNGSFGSVQWAEGDIVSHPTLGVFGEAGTEAFVPISNRAAGLRILPRVLSGLGIRHFANGGIVGRGSSLSAASESSQYVFAPVINGVGLSKQEVKELLREEYPNFMATVAKGGVMAGGRRSGWK